MFCDLNRDSQPQFYEARRRFLDSAIRQLHLDAPVDFCVPSRGDGELERIFSVGDGARFPGALPPLKGAANNFPLEIWQVHIGRREFPRAE